jgi:hypothetical protein
MRSTRRVAALALPLALAACGDSTGATPDVTGTYVLTRVTQVATCGPQDLPAPATTDSSRYVLFGAAVDTAQVVLRVQQMGNQLSVAPLDAGGQPQSDSTFTGPRRGDGSFTVRRARAFGNEAQRQGRRVFFVDEQDAVAGKFQSQGGAMRLTANATSAFRFLIGGASGTLFTTCVLPSTASGQRTLG